MGLRCVIVLVIVIQGCAQLASTQDNSTKPPPYYTEIKGTIRFKAKLTAFGPEEKEIGVTLANTKIDHTVSNNEPYVQIGLADKSYIRKGKRADNNIGLVVQTPGMASKTEKEYWIKLVPPATIMVGLANEKLPFMFWTDPSPIKMTYFGVNFCCDSTAGEWRKVAADSRQDGTICAPDDVKTANDPWSEDPLYIIKGKCYNLLTSLDSGTCSSQQVTASQTSKPTTAVATKKKTFILKEQSLNWDEAKAACERQGNKLASVRNKEEQVELNTLMRDVKNPISGVWLALNDRAKHNRFVWHDVDFASYTNWAPTASHLAGDNKNCVFASYVTLLVQNSALWFTQICKEELSFVCESFS